MAKANGKNGGSAQPLEETSESKIKITKGGIEPPKFSVVSVPIVGMEGSALVVNRFSDKAREQMAATQKLGSLGQKRRTKAPKDFDAAYEGAKHVSTAGWDGVAAAAFRHAMIGACRLVGFKMTIAKLSIFIEPDGISRGDGLPLVRIEGTPEPFEMPVRNATGVADIRIRPRWHRWSANVRIRFDSEQFRDDEIVNLLMRAGMQCGICEGRPSSTMSNGLDWGLFEIDKSKSITVTKLEIPSIIFERSEEERPTLNA
jgi:hypothetical protein